MRYIACLLLASGLCAQTTVYLRGPGTPAGGFVPIGASSTTPMVVQTMQAHSLSVGDTVDIWGVGASVSGKCIYSTANGIRVVSAVPDSTHFAITDQSGNPIAPNGAWCSGAVGGVTGAAAGGKLTAFTLASQPRAWLDGPTGTHTRKLALGTPNGLTSLVVSGNVATATTSYNHGINVGDNVSVWGSGVSALNNSGNPYTVTAVTATTFTFATTGVANGTYSNSNNTCGPASNQDCLRISQLAYNGNLWWDLMVKHNLNGWESGTSYKSIFDGGAQGAGGTDLLGWYWGSAAIKSFVDPSDVAMRNIAIYCVDHVERVGGVSFTVNSAIGSGGNYDLNDFASYTVPPLAACYAAARPYLSSTEIQTFANKMYNDRDDAAGTSCNYTRPDAFGNNEVLATGTAQAGSATSIKLAAADSEANGYYVNNVISASVAGGASLGTVTAYNSSTKIATVGGWSNGIPSTGTAYTIYATITISTTAGGATAIITGYNTHFTSDFVVGDAAIGGNTWQGGGYGVAEVESYITAIISDTSLAVINAGSVSAGVSIVTPTILWIARQWQAGDCGLKWAQSFWNNAPSLPSLYGANGAAGGQVMGYAGNAGAPLLVPRTGENKMFSYTAAWMLLDLALADDDPRAITHLAMDEEIWWDYTLNYELSYASGFDESGAGYSYGREKQFTPYSLTAIENSVPSFALPDFTAWAYGDAMQKMYGTYPDVRYSPGYGLHVGWPDRWGSDNYDNELSPGSLTSNSFQNSMAMQFFPNAAQSQYYLDYLKNSSQPCPVRRLGRP